MNDIVTLYQLQQHLAIDDGIDEARLSTALAASISQIEHIANRRFSPHITTIAHTVNPHFPDELILNDDLLELDAIACNDGNSIDASEALLIPHTPAGLIKLQHGSVFTWDDTPILAINVMGTWGWHDSWSMAWRDSNDVVKDAALGASDTSITVADTTAVDAAYQSPRLQVGHLLKIEDEYVRILAITVNAGADDVLTVERGANGTTAAAHTQNTPIYIYQAPPTIKMLCLRWAAWLYRVPDNRSHAQNLPNSLMKEVENLYRFRVS